MRILLIGGTGPTGLPLARELIAHGHDLTVLNRGLHPKPELAAVASITADPFDDESMSDALDSQTWDVIIAMYGRLRSIAKQSQGRCDRFISIGGVPAYRGWTDPNQYTPAGLPVPVNEMADLVSEPDIDEKGYRIVRTEQAVFDAHPTAVHFRYPYVYGPHQPVPREWSIVRRILDGRREIILADEGLTLHHHVYTENAAAAVCAAVQNPQRCAGNIVNVGDTEVLTIRQVVELCASALDAELEIVSMPYDLAVPAWPLLTQPLPTHRVLDLGRLHHELGHNDVVEARSAVPATARWLEANRPSPGGTEEKILTDPFDYRCEEALIASWRDARGKVAMPDFAQRPGWGLAYSGPQGRERTHKEFIE
jgi:nucleoside-diphosphate-sugar epimerase